MSCDNNLIEATNYFLEGDDTTQNFVIPKKLEKYHKIDGDLSNVKNWKVKVLVANSAGEGVKVGDWEMPRYILVNLKSNEIIPIAISDEHRTGWDLFYDKLQKLVDSPANDWMIVDSWGTTYLYKNEEDEPKIEALKKLVSYGADPTKLKVRLAGGYGYYYYNPKGSMTVADVIKKGLPGQKKKRASKPTPDEDTVTQLGLDLVDGLNLFVGYYKLYIDSSSPTTKKGLERNLRTQASKLHKLLIGKKDLIAGTEIGPNLMEITDLDIDMGVIAKHILGTGGIKNKIHNSLIRNNSDLGKTLFGSVTKMDHAFKQLDRM